MHRLVVFLFCFFCWASDAFAQQADTVTSATVGVASSQALAAGRRWYLRLENEGATATISCNFGGTAVLNAGSNFTLGPGVMREWQDFGVYPFFSQTISQQINCIASAAGAPLTIEYH